MDRRKFLAATVTAACGVAVGAQVNEATEHLLHPGWLPGLVTQARARFLNSNLKPYASQHVRPILGQGSGKVVRLWKAWEKVAGEEFEPHEQKISDCVGQAVALGVEMIDATEIVRGEQQQWAGKQSTEVIYIGSRVEIAKGIIVGGGSTVTWAAEFIQKYGSLPRGKYINFDVSKYNPKLARGNSTGWFPKGVPKSIEDLCAKHRLKAILVDGGFRQAADLVAAGFPVAMGAKQGFDERRDRDGFLNPNDEDWNHATLLCGVDTRSSRPGGCVANSWGRGWTYGPMHRHGCINGGFWADAHILNKMLMQGDSYALVNYDGLQPRNLKYIFS